MISRQRAAHLRLHLHRDHEQAQIVLRHALQHVGQSLADRQSKPRLLDHGAEFAAQRFGELLVQHLHPALQRVARFERRLQEIERVGQLDQKGLEPAAALEPDVEYRRQSESPKPAGQSR